MNTFFVSLLGVGFASCALALPASAAVLKVDIGGSGQAVQSDFVEWSSSVAASTSANDVGLQARIFTPVESAFGGFTATFDASVGEVRVRDRGASAATPIAERSLFRDGFIAFNTTLVANPLPVGDLTFTSLPAGPYQITTFHYDGSTSRTNPMNTFSISVDGVEVLANQSQGALGEPHSGSTFLFNSNGLDPVVVSFALDARNLSSDLWFNGFEMSLIPEPTSMALLGLGALGLLTRRRKA
jgi:hypothetical protein